MSTDKKKILTIVLLIITVFLSFSPNAQAVLYEDITAFEVKQKIDNELDNGYIILDIRDNTEYDQGHILGAINIPLKELGYRLVTLDRTKDVIVYCNIGLQSKVACQVLANAGFKDVYNLTGGLKEWNYALATSDGRVGI